MTERVPTITLKVQQRISLDTQAEEQHAHMLATH
jgi:hypothetical protein